MEKEYKRRARLVFEIIDAKLRSYEWKDYTREMFGPSYPTNKREMVRKIKANNLIFLMACMAIVDLRENYGIPKEAYETFLAELADIELRVFGKKKTK